MHTAIQAIQYAVAWCNTEIYGCLTAAAILRGMASLTCYNILRFEKGFEVSGGVLEQSF